MRNNLDCVKEGGKGVGCLPGSCSRLCEHLELPKKVEGLPKRKEQERGNRARDRGSHDEDG